MIKISASILAADFARLGEEVEKADRCGCEMIHFDVMDAHFVPNLTFGPMVLSALRPLTDRFMDVHLMVTDPLFLAPEYAKAGADGITFHAEAVPGRLKEAVEYIHGLGVKAGCSIKPGTPVEVLEEVLPMLDLVLVMTVEPGFGGQKLIPETLEKVRRIRELAPGLDIQVDGGVNDKTLAGVLEAGANVIVMGTGFFRAEDPAKVVRNAEALYREIAGPDA